jgi:hypothetical protein
MQVKRILENFIDCHLWVDFFHRLLASSFILVREPKHIFYLSKWFEFVSVGFQYQYNLIKSIPEKHAEIYTNSKDSETAIDTAFYGRERDNRKEKDYPTNQFTVLYYCLNE